MTERLIEINTDSMEPMKVEGDLYTNREAAVQMSVTESHAEVTVIVVAFNRLEKTKRCVESLLENTRAVDYELILIDNGSSDGTLDYFQGVPHEKKTIVHITHNVGSTFPMLNVHMNMLGSFVCIIQNDLILTPHWLENLLICMKSDPKIGMVNPVCCNTSNAQDVELPYSDYADMQRKAEAFNHSDPRKWEERLRLVTLGTVYRKTALFTTGWPLNDAGFFHDFGDDDISFRIRRMGYKTILAGDTWICHDHDLRRGEDKDRAEFMGSLVIGCENFRKKYFGVDAWDDVNNYIPYFSGFPEPHIKGKASVLGVDVRCGTPILHLKNWLRQNGIFETDLSAFVQDPKYWLDLKTICTGPVICDREEFLTDSLPAESFDYVMVDRPVNRYHEPIKVLRDLFRLCKPGGYVVCKLANAYSFREYLNLLGQVDVYNPDFAYNIPVEQFSAAMKQWGKIYGKIRINSKLGKDGEEMLASLYPPGLPDQQKDAALEQMQCEEFCYIVKKK